MWTSVLRYIKYQSNLKHKVFCHFAIQYLIAKIITSLEFFENQKNEQIKFCP